jgi:hypothetical protein
MDRDSQAQAGYYLRESRNSNHKFPLQPVPCGGNYAKSRASSFLLAIARWQPSSNLADAKPLRGLHGGSRRLLHRSGRTRALHERTFLSQRVEGFPSLKVLQRGVDKLLDKYAKAGYPYDAVQLLYLHDFVSSNQEATQLLPAIREWNAAGKQPRIVVSTPAEFFT